MRLPKTRGRILLLVILAALPGLGLSVYEAIERRQEAEAEARGELSRLARLAAMNQREIVDGTRKMLEASAPLLLALKDDAKRCNHYFRALQARNREAYHVIGLLGADGRLLCDSLGAEKPLDASERLYFRRALDTRAFAVGEYQEGYLRGTQMIGFGYPLLGPDRQVEGVAFAAIPLSALRSVAEGTPIPAQGVLNVVDRNGIVLAAKPEAEGRSGELLRNTAVLRALSASRAGVFVAPGLDGIDRLFSYDGVYTRAGEDYSMRVTVSVPLQQLFGDANRVLVREIAIMLLATALLVAIAWTGTEVFILRKVRGLLSAARRMHDGDMTARTGFAPSDEEFGELARTFDEMAEALAQRERTLQQQAITDPLTGLYNHALLTERLNHMLANAQRQGTQVAVLFVDLDGFKAVNDALGHAAGDELLKEIAQRLRACVRPTDAAARVSGDEFVVVLGHLARAEDAALVAQKIVGRIAEPIRIGHQQVDVTASIGIASYPANGADAEKLVNAADAAMYRAKQGGRNGYQFFTLEIDQRIRARRQLAAELRQSLERGEFSVSYQPKYSLHSSAAHSAEALLRWHSPKRGLVLPGEFVPVLEDTGLIVPVGEWVLKRVCEDLRKWQAEGLRVQPVAVNLSARQFRQGDLDARIDAVLGASGIDPKLLEVEITESHLMHDPDHAVRVLNSLWKSGIGVTIDDFGTGYSSLSYLTRFPVTALKIDQSFVRNVLQVEVDAVIVRTIVDMAHSLGCSVVAEGIETEAQASFLRGVGCELGQGFHFARPMPAGDYESMLARLPEAPGGPRPTLH